MAGRRRMPVICPYKTSGGYFPGMLAEYAIVNENGLVAAPETRMTLRPAHYLVQG